MLRYEIECDHYSATMPSLVYAFLAVVLAPNRHIPKSVQPKSIDSPLHTNGECPIAIALSLSSIVSQPNQLYHPIYLHEI